jgi:HAD superfamily hydrolase (TIGR01509 family)
VQAIIFDCDGTLIDSERLYAQANADVYQACGLDVSAAFLFEEYTGIGLKTVVPALAKRFAFTFPEDIYARLEASAAALLAQSLRAIAGVPTLLHALKKAHVPVGVASNSTSAHIIACLEKTNLVNFFAPNHIWGSDQVARPKPDPDVYLAAAQSLAIAPEACLAVEDSPTGIRAARAAGMRVIGYTDPAHAFGIDRLRAAGAHHIVTNMQAVLTYL